jgi:eukaryotic-like serine/threonine-protein kinase
VDPFAPVTRLNEALAGRYRIERELGEGAMATVYLAQDERHNRYVALKVLKPELAAVVGATRFLAEIETTAKLQHPHILPLFDSGEAGGFLFYVMPYVQGETLRDRIDREKQLPVDEALGIATAVAQALQTAHEAGVVHRDIKPGNILLSQGQPLVADFGIALAVGGTGGARLTRTGLSIGTPRYMSPEQATGDAAVGPSSDMFSLACVLYEMLVGQPPYTGRTAQEILGKLILGAPFSAAAVRKSIPPNVDAALRRALETLPADRFREVGDFAKALADPSFRHGEVADVSAATHRRWRLATMVFAVSTMALALLWMWALTRSDPPAQTLRVSVWHLGTPFVSTVLAGDWYQPLLALAPDGSSLVYVSQTAASSERQLFLRRMNRGEAQPLAGTDGATSPFYSPDGSSVGFFADGRLKKVSLVDRAVQTVATGIASSGAVWTRDNSIIISGEGFVEGLIRVSAATGTREPLTRLEPGEAVHRWPSLSPSGRIVVYTTSNTTGPGLEEPHLIAESLDSGRREILAVDATWATFAPDGRHLLLVRGGTLVAIAFDPDQLRVSGSPVPLGVEGVIQSSTGATQLAASSSALAYLQGASETRRLVWVDRQGRVEPIAEAPQRLYVHPRLSPDGTRIAVTISEPKNDVWTFDLDRGLLSVLTLEGSNAYPIWSADGTMIYYISRRQGHAPNVFRKSASGTGPEERLLTSENPQVTETFAPDETLLFVERRPDTNWDILTLSPADPGRTKEFLATTLWETTPQISPSGRWVAHGWTRTGSTELFLHSYPDPDVELQVTTGGGRSAAWRRDERELYYQIGDAMMAVDVTTEPKLSVGRPRLLFRGPFASIQGKNYDVTPDGQRFLMVQTIDPVAPKDVTVVLNWMENLNSPQQAK